MSKAPSGSRHPGKTGSNKSQLRVIGGEWRGRKLSFTPEEGLRPTADRIRETLFNWLAADIHGARCADLFAGSGALGIEALSRGAATCDFIEPSRGSCTQIAHHLDTLGALDRGTCHNLSASAFLRQPHQAYDIIFIDPPFDQALETPTCQLIEESNCLATSALVYLESSADKPCPEVPDHWALHRDKVSGGVAYRLFHARAQGNSSGQ
jgi:16S rRNA (guanine966-N2)-methyltransferase